jgi:hypothetical protein
LSYLGSAQLEEKLLAQPSLFGISPYYYQNNQVKEQIPSPPGTQVKIKVVRFVKVEKALLLQLFILNSIK